MAVTSASPLESSPDRRKRNRFGTATIAASLALALGAGCGGGSGGSQPASSSPGGSPAGGQTGSSGNTNGQSGSPTGQGGSAQGGPSSGGASPGAGGSAATGGSAGSATTGTGGGTTVGGATGNGGTAGASGGATGVDVDGGACCNTADCQPDAVKTCVCTTWQQTQCCSGTWDTFCQATAEQKCQAEKCATEPSPPTPDAGHIVKGACCAVHATPGCDDPDIEKCTCALLSDCCTNQWDAVCVQLVREKRCETGVRTCVCDNWQASCCDTEWTNACGIIAESKCNAQPSCP